MDLGFFKSDDGFFYHPRKHWCFLGQITDMDEFLRLRFVVEDKAGTKIPFVFYTDSRGRELNPSQVRRGFTVACLYPGQHGFLDMTVGIRHEASRFLKVRQALS